MENQIKENLRRQIIKHKHVIKILEWKLQIWLNLRIIFATEWSSKLNKIACVVCESRARASCLLFILHMDWNAFMHKAEDNKFTAGIATKQHE